MRYGKFRELAARVFKSLPDDPRELDPNVSEEMDVTDWLTLAVDYNRGQCHGYDWGGGSLRCECGRVWDHNDETPQRCPL